MQAMRKMLLSKREYVWTREYWLNMNRLIHKKESKEVKVKQFRYVIAVRNERIHSNEKEWMKLEYDTKHYQVIWNSYEKSAQSMSDISVTKSQVHNQDFINSMQTNFL
jgi:hypothetical protein